MSDDLDKLRAALKAVPAPDPAKKAFTIAKAEKEFANTQGLHADMRPMSDRPNFWGRIWTRIIDMFAEGFSRPAMLAGSSLMVLIIAGIVITPTLQRDGSVLDGGTAGVDGLMDMATPTPATPHAKAENDVMADVPMVVEPIAEEESPMAGQNQVLLDAILGAPQSAARLDENALQRLMTNDKPRASLTVPDIPVGRIEAEDRFPELEGNGLNVTTETPVSTFSVDVDTTSYAMWRMSVLDGYPLPKDAIRIEEMINYFDFDYADPTGLDVPFTTNVAVSPTPWNPGTHLMQIGIQGYDVVERDPMGLVFLIDTSGSMQDAKKLPLLIRSFGMLLNTLGPEDSVAIVTYAGSAGVALDPTPASDRATIQRALDALVSGGSTAGQAGLQEAYRIAGGMTKDGQSARVILATDGDFNVGISDPSALTDYIAEQRDSGVALSVLGFGRGNYADTTMQALAQNGNGVAAYIDNLAEAQKVLVDDVTGSLVTIAADVKVQVEFNPAQISEYRLIGYETRALNREDFNNDRVDAGDIGSGHAMTAIYEVTPVGSEAELVDNLRYGAAVEGGSAEWAHVKLRYKQPGQSDSALVSVVVDEATDGIAASEVNFATAVAGAGRVLRGQDLGDWSLEDAAALAADNLGSDPFGYRAEFLRLVRLAAAQTQK